MANLSTSTGDLITQVERDIPNPRPRIPSNFRSCQVSQRNCAKTLHCSPKYMLLTMKSVILILLWTILVGSIYSSVLFAIPLTVPRVTSAKHDVVFVTAVVVYAFLALIMMAYPLGGILGDMCLGRYRTVVLGLSLLVLSMVLASVDSILLFIYDEEKTSQDKAVHGSFIAIAIISFAILVAGFSAFNSNVVQLGLDQLMEEPSGSLGVFVHWFVWSFRFGQVIIHFFFTARECTRNDPTVGKIIFNIMYSLPMVFMILLAIFLLLNCCTRGQFITERVKYNPYKMIVKVLNFARKNKYPVGPTSAFAYCDDTIPSRIDYAKERYGGPFTTSDVEDVKTFIRVLLVLLALGAVFILDVPSSYVLFSVFALHTGQETSFNNETCGSKWMLLESGTLSSLTVVVILPIYIWIVYSFLRNRIPKILSRLGFAVCLYIVAVLSMLVVDLAGHISLYTHHHSNVMCMFVEPIFEKKHFDTLGLHWSVLILPNILKNLAPDLIIAAASEFISAQSPHTMKGVLVGMLFAFRGLFQFVGVVLFLPFSLHQIWKHGSLKHDPPVTSCGFGYYLVTTAVALIGLCLFTIAVKKYKYRKREEEPFSQAQVEEIFSRRIQQGQSRRREDKMNSVVVDGCRERLMYTDDSPIG